MSEYTHTLVATLGGQPQVVTFTLDLLLRRGFPIREVIVIHPYASEPYLQHSLNCLNAEFISDHYRPTGQIMHLRSHVLQLDEEVLNDIVDDISANGALETIHQLIRQLRQQPRCIHLSVSGGRRLMALMAISAAQLNFKHNIDHIWHIYTPEEIKQQVKDGTLMHIPASTGVTLIEMPFVPWKTYFSALPQPGDASAKGVLSTELTEVEAQERKRCKQVEDALTPTKRNILRAFASGLTPQEVAEKFCITPSTVSSHTTKIFDECRIAWNLVDRYPLNYHFLRERFEKCFSSDE